MEQERLWSCVRTTVVCIGLLSCPSVGLAQWSVEKPGTATLPKIGGRATLFIQCTQHGAEPALYLHQPLDDKQLVLAYRFDDDDAQTRVVVSPSGQVLKIWGEEEKENFSRAKRLRIQLRPFMVFDFDLRGLETVAAKLQCS